MLQDPFIDNKDCGKTAEERKAQRKGRKAAKRVAGWLPSTKVEARVHSATTASTLEV